jgi:uncharacterized protein YecE (DUF72 family)
MRRWRAEAPSDFEFTIKAWQLITHDASSPTYRRLRTPMGEADRAGAGGFRTSAIVLRAWERTLACAAILRATAILFQCPASFRPTDDNIDRMRAFFATIKRPTGVRMLWEPRGEWPTSTSSTLGEASLWKSASWTSHHLPPTLKIWWNYLAARLPDTYNEGGA